jgi:hypothetical protein
VTLTVEEGCVLRNRATPIYSAPSKRLLLLLSVLFTLLTPVPAQEALNVFQGIPIVKISESGDERVPENVPREKAVNLSCVISKIGDRYYWASRENTLMRRVQAGAFTTFVAENGSGYVRVISTPEVRKMFKYAYVEHLLIGLNSVTYYGMER